jgi:hypothetical protein
MYAEICSDHLHRDRSSTSCVLLCTCLCAASCERFSDCPPLLSARFLTPTTGTCQAAPVERGAAPVIPMVTVCIPPRSMGKTRVVVQVAMILLDHPAAGDADHEAAHHPLSLRVARLQRLPGIGTIGLIQVLAGYQPPPLFRRHRSACAVNPA